MFGTGFTPKEKYLVEQERIALEFMGGTPSEARKVAKQNVKEAIAESKASGLYRYGPLGSHMMTQYKDNGMWEGLQREGVRETDIMEWWDLDDVERCIMRRDDGLIRLVLCYLSIEG